MLIIVQVLKENCFKNHGFFSFTSNKQNKAFNDSARVGGQDRKKTARSGPGTNQIAGLGEFRPLAN